MQINLEELKEKISKMSDEELLKMLRENKEDYTSEALEIATEQVKNRGGLETIKNKYQKHLVETQRISNEEQKRVEEVKKNYRIIDYSMDTWVRWYKIYGGLVLAWIILYKFGVEENLSVAETISSAKFWISIIILLFLTIVQSLIYSLVKYKKAIKNMIAVKCGKCTEVSIFEIPVIKMKADHFFQYNTKCIHCKSSLKVNLDFIVNKRQEAQMEEGQNVKFKEKKQIEEKNIRIWFCGEHQI